MMLLPLLALITSSHVVCVYDCLVDGISENYGTPGGTALVTGHGAGCSTVTHPAIIAASPLTSSVYCVCQASRQQASILMSPQHVFIMAFIKHLLTTNQHCDDQLVA